MDFSQFWSDFLSTVLGVALALIGAIWLEKYTQQKEEESKNTEKRSRARLILDLIKKELEYNIEALKVIDDNIYSTYRYLRIESWKAFTDGGEIKWVDDPELLANISMAYSNLIHFILLYEKYFNMRFFPKDNTYHEQGKILTNITMKSKHDALNALIDAKHKIEQKIIK